MDAGKPTCGTCPYAASVDGGGDLVQFPPNDHPELLVYHQPRMLRADLHVRCCIRGQDGFPLRRKVDFCGEHPDFPAWLAAQRPAQDAQPEDAIARDRDGWRTEAEKWRTEVERVAVERDRYRGTLEKIAADYEWQLNARFEAATALGLNEDGSRKETPDA